jgi:hypothetical protein
VRSEEELRKFLEECGAVSGFGCSEGPCPLKVNDKKDCLEFCDFPEDSEDRKTCCDNWGRGCCAECSFPSAIAWVLGKDNNPSDNGQKRLIQALKEEI